MENSEVSDEKLDLLASGHLLSSSSFKGSEVIENESVFYEKFLLDDLDSYWDELNDRLTVSRMVSESVVKGMVRAVVEDSTEKIASKEAEIETLNEKLQSCDHCSLSSLKAKVEWFYSENVDRLRLAAEEQLQKLKDDIHIVRFSNSDGRLNSLPVDVGMCSIFPHAGTGEKLMEMDEGIDSLRTIVEELFRETNEMLCSVKTSVFELQWEREFEREISALVTQCSFRGLQDEFETKLYEQGCLINMLHLNSKQKFSELSSMREELDTMFRSLLSSDSGPLLLHNSMDFDELNDSKLKDQKVLVTHAEGNGITSAKGSEDFDPMLEVADVSQLRHMSRDELASYYRTEMMKMRRQHEAALHMKTEELFKLKREFLREKGSSLFKKDREFELLKRRIPEVIMKLDDILLEKEKLPMIQNDHDDSCSLEGRSDTLLLENQRLRDLLHEQEKEVKNLSLQISDAASQISRHSLAEAKLLLQTKKLKEDLEDMKAEANIRDEMRNIFLKGIVCEKKCVMEDLEVDARIMEDIHNAVVREFISSHITAIDSTTLEYITEKSSLKALLYEKEEELSLEIEENKKLKETISSLSMLMEEKDKFASETSSTMMQIKDQFDLLDHEIQMLRDQVAKQEILISDYKLESCSTKRTLNDAVQQIRQNQTQVKELNGKIVNASNALKEAENQNHSLHGIIEDKEKELLSFFMKDKEQARQMEFIVSSLMGLLKASMDLENKFAENIGRHETRVMYLSRQCHPLMQQANLLTKKAFLYKQMLEIKSSNLQKAESEVDLLGDEVDSLLSLLGKIYIALDHYSPILQHYPGVMEILKLVRRELEGETAKSV